MKLLRFLFLFIILFEFQLITIRAQKNIELIKDEILADSYLSNAAIGICVMDLSTGNKIVMHQPKLSLPCASTAKLFSTASAFEMLGENYQPKTRIYYSGELSSEGKITGNIWIRGGGDPSLGSRYYNGDGRETDFLRKWADTLYAMGIRSIDGAVVGDGSEFGYKGAPDGWSWNDMGNYYGAGPAGLTIFDNMLRYYFKVNSTGTVPVLTKTFPEIEHLNFSNYIIASAAKGDNSYIYGAPFSLERIGTGYLQMNSTIMVKGSIPDPELQFAEAFKKVLEECGITVSGKAKGVRTMEVDVAWRRYASDHQLLYSHKGINLSSILNWTNMKSVNLFAEQLVCLIGYNKNGDGSTENGLKQISQFWGTRINTNGLYLKDGSGLSRSDAISAEHFCDLLNYMNNSKNSTAFKSTLPVAGISGTMSDVCKGQAAQGKVSAKSGTMQRIKSYAGYVTTKSGKELAFAIIFNNYNCSTSYLMGKIEKFMNAMALYE